MREILVPFTGKDVLQEFFFEEKMYDVVVHVPGYGWEYFGYEIALVDLDLAAFEN